MKIVYHFILIILCLSCTGNSTSNTEKPTNTSTQQDQNIVPLKWAKNFRIRDFKTYKQVELLNNNTVYQTILIGDHIPSTNQDAIHINPPLSNIASASCVYTKMFEVLGVLNTIKGIDKLDFQFSNQIVEHVKNNTILEFGSGDGLKTEELFILNPEVLFTWSSNQSSQQIDKLIKLGIPVVFASSYLESHPLARAEWIKVFALFVDKFEEAVTFFNQIESNYLKISKNNPTNLELALVNAPYSGQWYLPTGNSYMGNLLKDAGFKTYLQDSNTLGALAYTFEDVIAHHQDAEFWFNPGFYETLSQIETIDHRFNQLEAFKHKNVFNAIKRKRPNGGNDYWEQGVVRPDLVLKDLNHIYKGSPKDSLYFFTKLDK